jgi:hypothetical protein
MDRYWPSSDAWRVQTICGRGGCTSALIEVRQGKARPDKVVYGGALCDNASVLLICSPHISCHGWLTRVISRLPTYGTGSICASIQLQTLSAHEPVEARRALHGLSIMAHRPSSTSLKRLAPHDPWIPLWDILARQQSTSFLQPPKPFRRAASTWPKPPGEVEIQRTFPPKVRSTRDSKG